MTTPDRTPDASSPPTPDASSPPAPDPSSPPAPDPSSPPAPDPASPPAPDPGRDRGAALIVAIGFVVMIGAIAAGLTSMVTSGVGNRAALEQIRDRQYAADGAVEDAVASTRALLDVGAVTCGDVSARSISINDVDIRVELVVTCAAVVGADGFPVLQLSGAFAACEDRHAACEPAEVVVRALVAFETDPGGSVVGTSVRSWSVLR